MVIAFNINQVTKLPLELPYGFMSLGIKILTLIWSLQS